MAKYQLRTCNSCGVQEETFSKSLICGACVIEQKKIEKIAEERLHLESLGYKILGDTTLSKSGHRKYRLIAPCCGVEFAPTYGNVLKQLALHNKPPCQNCGGKERMGKAMAAYVEKYGADYDIQKFEEYRLKVRRLTGRTYECWKHVINPMNYQRGHGAGYWHLDHKVPTIWCFKNGIAPEVAASLQNLQMLPSEENLKKCGKLLSDEEAMALLRESQSSALLFVVLGESARAKIDLVADTANIFSTNNKLIIRETEFKKSASAVIARCKYHLQMIQSHIGARKLVVKEVSQEEANVFLEKWHVQGKASCSWAIGLYQKDELFSLMTFAPPRYKQLAVDFELVRFCSRGDIVVQGAASKLFAHYKTVKKPSRTVSYSLNRWGSGNLYKTLGFEFKSSSLSPRYLWRNDGKIRSWRASILMARKRNINLVGGEIDGTLKIHDPGSTTWMMTHAIKAEREPEKP